MPLGADSYSTEITGRLLSWIERETASLASVPISSRRKATLSLSFRMEEGFAARGFSPVAGVDEVGRGPLAGPVVAAAVSWSPRIPLPGLNDSKRIPPERRLALFPRILESAAAVSVGLVTAEGIDRWNIHRASRIAMSRAVEALPDPPKWVLIDGIRLDDFPHRQVAVVGADGKIPIVAAASVVAKVVRDRLMDCYHKIFPAYRFDRHKGYATAEHAERIHRFGPSAIHRKTFHVPDVPSLVREEEEWIA